MLKQHSWQHIAPCMLVKLLYFASLTYSPNLSASLIPSHTGMPDIVIKPDKRDTGLLWFIGHWVLIMWQIPV